jgi:hypothetical protein
MKNAEHKILETSIHITLPPLPVRAQKLGRGCHPLAPFPGICKMFP